jgi:uncharacterized protein YjcR
MNQSDFAHLHGVSRKTVTMWKSRGWLIMSGDDMMLRFKRTAEKYRKASTGPINENACRQKKRNSPVLPARE